MTLPEPAVLQRLLDAYPSLAALPSPDRDAALADHAMHVKVPAGTLLFEAGRPCQGFPMVLAGSVRVARGSPGGRSLELYRVVPGEICVLSTSCLLGGTPLSALGETVQPTELVLLGPAGFARLTGHEAFRRYVFGVFAERLADLMSLVEAVAFLRLDQRLAGALLGRGSTVSATHQSLADELGTVREIVSRLLSRFERSGWVRLGRERIELLDVGALRSLAAGHPPSPDGHPPAAV